VGPLFDDCVFIENTSYQMGGGAFVYFAMATFVDCDFLDNTATGYAGIGGGGVVVDDQSEVLLERCEIAENAAVTGDGGGVYCHYYAELEIHDSFIFGNEAQSGNGGGVRVGGQSTADCIGCSFAENIATEGGGVYIMGSSTQTLINSILWQNAATSGNGPQIAIRGAGSTLNVDFCDVDGDLGNVYDPDWANVNWVSAIDVDPLFVDQAQGNLHLQAESECIDAGDQSQTASVFDIDREARLYNEVDIGADERGPMVCEPHFIDYATGGTVTFHLDAGSGGANRMFLIAGSSSGISGFQWGSLWIPLVWDWYTDYTISGAVPGFVGFLDGNGKATVDLDIPTMVGSSLIGTDFNHAFVYLLPGQGAVWVSNACTFELDLY